MIEQITAYRLTCDVCGNVRIVAIGDAHPRRCARKACQSTAWNKNDTTHPALVEPEVKPQKRAAKPQIEVAPQEEKPQPIARAPKAKNPPWKEVKPPAGKKKICPHGFLIDRGITACARCN